MECRGNVCVELNCFGVIGYVDGHPCCRAQAQVSCAPTFVLPGFMKAGTTFAYDVITRHPQVLKAQRGVVFKETGCYLDPRAAELPGRMQCFPFVPESQGLSTTVAGTAHTMFAFGDGTVYYATRKHVAAAIQRYDGDSLLHFCH